MNYEMTNNLSKTREFIFKIENTVAEQNVHMTIDNIRNQSPVLKEMEDDGVIKIVGAMYNIQDGSVVFY